MNDNLKSTKFIISMVTLGMVFTAFMMDKIGATEFMPFVLGILGIYTTGNTISKALNKESAN